MGRATLNSSLEYRTVDTVFKRLIKIQNCGYSLQIPQNTEVWIQSLSVSLKYRIVDVDTAVRYLIRIQNCGYTDFECVVRVSISRYKDFHYVVMSDCGYRDFRYVIYIEMWIQRLPFRHCIECGYREFEYLIKISKCGNRGFHYVIRISNCGYRYFHYVISGCGHRNFEYVIRILCLWFRAS